MNTISIKVDGTEYSYECHTVEKAMLIINKTLQMLDTNMEVSVA